MLNYGVVPCRYFLTSTVPADLLPGRWRVRPHLERSRLTDLVGR